MCCKHLMPEYRMLSAPVIRDTLHAGAHMQAIYIHAYMYLHTRKAHYDSVCLSVCRVRTTRMRVPVYTDQEMTTWKSTTPTYLEILWTCSWTRRPCATAFRYKTERSRESTFHEVYGEQGVQGAVQDTSQPTGVDQGRCLAPS